MPSKKQHQERQENISEILKYFRKNGSVTRKQISYDLYLSWGCVSELVAMLLSKNILVEAAPCEHKNRGRWPAFLQLNPEIHFLGVDINRNGLKGCICNLLGEKGAKFSGELRYDSKNRLIESVVEFVNTIIKQHKNINGIGFAMQGILNLQNNIWEFPAEKSISIAFDKDFAERFDVPVVVEHDPNCILYGCVDTNEKNCMVVRLDRGIGAAIYKDNTFLKKDLLEIGYLVVYENGTRLHDIVSVNTIEKTLGGNIRPEYCGEETERCFHNIGKYLGIALGNICNFIHLDEIFLCGDLILHYSLFSEAMMKSYKMTVLTEQAAKISAIRITNAAFGAAKMAMDRFVGD